MTWTPAPIYVGDTFRYSNGTEYVITDGGPVVMCQCYICGAPAGATFEAKLAAIRCSTCLSREYEMLPGQRVYELKAQYAAEHGLAVKPSSTAHS